MTAEMLPDAAVGLGTLLLKESCEAAVTTAVEAGCQVIDTGEHYDNLELVGAALSSSLKKGCACPLVVVKLSGMPAGEYVTVRARLVSILEKLGVAKAGLCLMHWPGLCDWDPTDMAPLTTPSDFQAKSAASTWQQFCSSIASAWTNMLELQKEGLVKEIGTSNFYAHHLEELAKQCGGAKPFANEIFIDATNQESEFVADMQRQDIRVLAYRPLIYKPYPEVVTKMAERLGESPQSTVLGWLLKRGISPLVKCRGEHVSDNLSGSVRVRDAFADADLEEFKIAETGLKFSSEWFAKIWKTHDQALGGVSEEHVQMLVGLGVEEAKARSVLEECGGNLDAAMDAAFS